LAYFPLTPCRAKAYSDLAVLGNGEIACLYEMGKKGPYETIMFARFSLNTLK
jgi:sialidase-1